MNSTSHYIIANKSFFRLADEAGREPVQSGAKVIASPPREILHVIIKMFTCGA